MSAHPASIRRASLAGAAAVLLWALLAPLTTFARRLPPFELVALTFALAFLLGFAIRRARGGDLFGHLRQPLPVWLLGVGGLFGYHLCYFTALRLAPPVEASLVCYLWPLLIVLGSGLITGERLHWWHVLGGAAGLLGTALLVTGGQGLAIDLALAPGYAMALAAALVWSSYSMLSRRFGEVSSDAVGGFCGATAVLAALCHLLLETTVVPEPGEWLAVLALGLGPVGAAFFLWDHGVKHGSLRALGGFSYMAPLISTILLLALGRGTLSLAIALGGLLIVGGAAFAAGDLWRRT
jgi:drug/metabolite transporter (DMT)-like permease